MSTVKWRGDAPVVAQITTITLTAYDVTTTYKVTVNGKVISTVGVGGTTTTTATALLALLQACTEPEFLEITWTASTNVITGTAATPGQPFTATGSVSGGAGTQTTATPTASSGPNDWSLAANWSTGAVPIAADDVVFEASNVDVLYGLAQSAVTLTSLTILASYTGRIGNPDFNPAGGYYEYRATYLAVSATTLNVGAGSGAGSGRLKLNVGTVACTLNVYGTGVPVDANISQALLFKGTNAGNVANVYRGTVGIAALVGETATVATLRIGFISAQASDAVVYCGTGVTLTTITQDGGVLTTQSNLTTVNHYAGTHTILAGTVTTLTIDSGTVFYQSTGTCTTAAIGSDGVLDCSQDLRGRTITNVLLVYERSAVRDPGKTLTLTAGLTTVRCGLADVTLDFGDNRTYTVT